MKKQNNKIFHEKIIPLRDNIDKIDSQILSLLARRHDQVLKVVNLKKEHNIPVYHPAREEDLIYRLRTQAKKADLDPDFLEELYRTILRHSRVKQTDQMEINGILPNGRVLIIGGKGQMGSFFASLFIKSGYEVRILGKSDWSMAEQLCQDIDLALISVPIEQTCDIIEKLSPYLPLNAVLADLTSIKLKPVNKMLACHKGPVTGLHPLFGPDPGSLDKQIIVTTPGRDSKACQWVINQLSVWGGVIVSSSAQEHDKIMEIVQVLRHFATFCFGQFLFDQRTKIERTLEFSSPIYRLELGMVGRLFAQDASLYSEIIFASKSRRTLLNKYVSSLKTHIEMLEKNDKKLFVKKFNTISEWFGPFSEQALQESTFLIDRLIERF
ncbi:MAG: bifunctional chorismate mutase/prephenate dehydrogenase [Desulfobacula sp.]|nr:bifunctional chorismate mutase/prephenate dehydrogenase [Desulfobacula sp.]